MVMRSGSTPAYSDVRLVSGTPWYRPSRPGGPGACSTVTATLRISRPSSEGNPSSAVTTISSKRSGSTSTTSPLSTARAGLPAPVSGRTHDRSVFLRTNGGACRQWAVTARTADAAAAQSRLRGPRCCGRRGLTSGGPGTSRTGPQHVGGRLDDLPERAVGALVPDAAVAVPAIFFQHAQADEPAELSGQVTLQDHFAGRLGLVETWLVMPDYPEGQRQPAGPPEELLAHLVYIHWRVPELVLVITI